MTMPFSAVFERFLARSKLQYFLSLFVPLTLLYGATASWHLHDFDVITNTVSAWHLGVLALIAYNLLTFEKLSVLVGYSDVFA